MRENDISPTLRLFAAIADGSISGVEEACENGANVNAVNSENNTPLYLACSEGFAHIVEYLLEHPDIDITRGGYYYNRQTVVGCVYTPSGPPEYHATPLCAAVAGGHRRIVQMLLWHKERDKYLQPNDEWETTIARAFRFEYISSELVILIEAAMEYDRKFLLFTLQKVIKYGSNQFHANPEKLATILKQFPSEIRALALGCFATRFIDVVKDNDEYGELSNLLEVAPYFCETKRLRPYLLSALHLARQLRCDYCVNTLCEALEGAPKPVPVH